MAEKIRITQTTLDEASPFLRDSITKGGFELISDEEAANAAYIVCAPWVGFSYFTDDVRVTCCRCPTPLRVRPTAPRKPKRICLPCVLKTVH